MPVKDYLIISLPVVILSATTALISLVSYLWVPKKLIVLSSLLIYFLLLASSAGLIETTGDLGSPFIALWTIVALFAAVFGIWGLAPILLVVGAFAGKAFIQGDLNLELAVTASFAGLVPVLVSFIIWHTKSGFIDKKDQTYRDLATELSQVATQSEVVINAIGDGVIAIDGQGAVQLINPAAGRILGWGSKDAMSLSYKSVLLLVDDKGVDLTDAIDPIQNVLNTNQQIRDNDLTLMTHSGKKISASIVASPIGESGSGVIIVFRDITKEKADEREQAEFISTASHEMRTPVASIEGYLGLALNPATAQIDDKARDFIMKAHLSAQHLGRLFQDLLDVSKAEDGRLSNNPKVIDVMAYTHDIMQGLHQKAADKGLQLIFKPMPNDEERHLAPVYNVNLDNDHIREVINNLTENAIKYTIQGTIVVDVTGDDEKVVISIADSGVGIPAEDMSHLFQKFYRVDSADTRQIAGTGLGLYLCRRLAEAMGGRIWAESEYKKGSTFYLELPRIDSAEAARITEQQTIAADAEARRIASLPPPVATTVTAATTVPRGESLTPEQIAAHVAKLQAFALEQSDQPAVAQSTPQQLAPKPQLPPQRSQSVVIPQRQSGRTLR